MRTTVLLCLISLLCGCSSSIRYSRAPLNAPPESRAQAPAPEPEIANATLPPSGASADENRLLAIIKSYLGTPYRRGGMDRGGMDCSGFVCVVYREYDGRALPRQSGDMARAGTAIALSAARVGDCLFFKGGMFNRIDHVGIYIGASRFAHASSSSGVIISVLDDDYYRRHFAFARRL